MNETSAKDWLIKAWHHLHSAKVLFDGNHYTDCIAVDLHYAAEITLKSILAYRNIKIVKTHDLLELHALLVDEITFNDDELDILDQITRYHIQESYPTRDRKLPERQEIRDALDFTNGLFESICNHLDISTDEIKAQ